MPAILPGLPQLIRTVSQVKSPDSPHTHNGGMINSASLKVKFVITMGSIAFPSSQPRTSPTGIPTADNTVP